jgi:DNA primase
LFPIFDVKGDAVGFGGRILPGAEGSKYWNSTESAIYAKSKLLYGLNWSKGAIVAADEAIVCEGYTDVIGFAAAGMPRAVATCGTSLTEEHFRILKSFARRIVLAFDADAAGQNAAARFYEWERAYDIDVAVAALPAGVDPADLARSDPEALAAAVADATPFLGFRVNRVLDGASLVSPEGRARAAEEAMGVIAEHPSELVRDQYLMEVASRTRIDPNQLRSGPFTRAATTGPGGPNGSGRGRVVRAESGSQRSRPRPQSDSPETEALRLLLVDGESISASLADGLFAEEVNLAAYRVVTSTATLRDAVEAADSAVAELLTRLAVEETDAEVDEVIVRLVTEAARRELMIIQSEVVSADETTVFARSGEMAWVKLRMEELLEPATSIDAVEQLLAWLQQQPQEIR